jgi:SAM-dependent methyltransferase
MARYDGVANWYDGYISRDAAGFTRTVRAAVARLLGCGSGRCLDAGCGTGIHISTVQALGWSVVGVDVSGDQLRVARGRTGPRSQLVHADAATLPFVDDAFDAAYATLIHTDVEDIAGVFAEVRRVIRPGGRFVYVGTHPCFVGPFAERKPDGIHVLHPGYCDAGWRLEGPGLGPGIRSRVGVRHVPLGDLLMAVLDAGLTLSAIEEIGNPLPALLALSTTKPGPG